MATNKNITMKQFNGADYDTLYPKTKVEQVEGAYSQQQILADSTKALYDLGSNAVPDDVFSYLSKSYVRKNLVQYTAETNDDIVFDLKNVDWSKRIFIEIVPTMGEKNIDTHRYFVNAKTDSFDSVTLQQYAYFTSTTWTNGGMYIDEQLNVLGKDSPIILELKASNVKNTGIGYFLLTYSSPNNKIVCFYAQSNNNLMTKLVFSKYGTEYIIGDRFTLFELG